MDLTLGVGPEAKCVWLGVEIPVQARAEAKRRSRGRNLQQGADSEAESACDRFLVIRPQEPYYAVSSLLKRIREALAVLPGDPCTVPPGLPPACC